MSSLIDFNVKHLRSKYDIIISFESSFMVLFGKTHVLRYPTWINCTLIENYNKIKIQFQGHCFIVFDPKAFTDDFEDRMSELIDYCRQLESVSIACNVVAFTAT